MVKAVRDNEYREPQAGVQVQYVLVPGGPGATGPIGPDGPSGRATVVAAETIHAYYVIGLDGHGEAYPVSCLVEDDAVSVLGVAIFAALVGEPVTAATDGPLALSGTWTQQGDVYLGSSGELVFIPPSPGFVLKIGTVISSETMIVRIEPPIFLA